MNDMSLDQFREACEEAARKRGLEFWAHGDPTAMEGRYAEGRVTPEEHFFETCGGEPERLNESGIILFATFQSFRVRLLETPSAVIRSSPDALVPIVWGGTGYPPAEARRAIGAGRVRLGDLQNFEFYYEPKHWLASL